MRVLHLNLVRDSARRAPADLLDAWPTLASVASAVRSAGADISVVQSSDADATHERDGVTFHFVAEPWLGAGPAAGYSPRRIVRAVKSLKADVIHVHGLGFPFHTRAVCAVGPPVLVQDHADRPTVRWEPLRRWGLANVAGVAFTAREQAGPFFQSRTLRRGLPVFSIPESSTDFRSGDTEEAKTATGLLGRPAILWVGHLDTNKDPITILDAFSRAIRQIPDAHLWLCYGTAPLLDKVRARVAEDPRLCAQVHLLGVIPHAHVERLCRAADFFVLGSKRESCGYGLLEAIACGATPIVSDIPAFRAITGNGHIGALCNPGDAAGFSDAMIALSKHPAKELRARAIEHFNAELSFPVLGRKLVAAYQSLIDHRTKSKRDDAR